MGELCQTPDDSFNSKRTIFRTFNILTQSDFCFKIYYDFVISMLCNSWVRLARALRNDYEMGTQSKI